MFRFLETCFTGSPQRSWVDWAVEQEIKECLLSGRGRLKTFPSLLILCHFDSTGIIGLEFRCLAGN